MASTARVGLGGSGLARGRLDTARVEGARRHEQLYNCRIVTTDFRMPIVYFSILFVIAVLAMVVTKLWLASRQIRFVAAHRADVPPQFAAKIPLTAHQRAADYT